jgi:uncharacterized protein YabN with tetrapyrrole methylase and pyrophosphatase domain
LDKPGGEVEWVQVEKTFEELKKAISISDKEKIGKQVGEILFGVVHLAKDWGLNAESLLRQANQEFIQRVEEMERELGTSDRELDHVAEDEAERSHAKGKIKEE